MIGIYLEFVFWDLTCVVNLRHGAWYMFDKMAETSKAINEGAEITLDIIKGNQGLLAAQSNIRSGGSGITDG